MRLRATIATTLAVLVALAFARAKEPQQAPAAGGESSLFERLDSNSDGAIAADEAPADKQALFDRLIRQGDANDDRKLDRQEFDRAMNDDDQPRPTRRDAGPPAGRRPLERLRQLDKNGDGAIALDEVPEQARPVFERILDQFDDNADDTLSREEFRKAAGQMRDRSVSRAPSAGRQPRPGLFGRLDANGDGKLSEAEQSAAPSVLKSLDADGDGQLTPDEAVGPDSPPQRPQADARPGVDALRDRLSAGDKDGDGRISKDEAPERLRERFDRLDENGDGFIDKAELESRLGGLSRRAARFGK